MESTSDIRARRIRFNTRRDAISSLEVDLTLLNATLIMLQQRGCPPHVRNGITTMQREWRQHLDEMKAIQEQEAPKVEDH